MIYLVRHGESEANINKKFCGITDVELSGTGIKQAINAGEKLKEETIHNIFSSPLRRAQNTAEIIAGIIGFNKNNIIIENCITEVNFGIFENLTWEEIETQYADEIERWMKFKHKYKFPKGEGYDDIIERISDFIDNVPDNSLIVTHFGVIQSMLLYLNIVDDSSLWSYNISNCDIVVLNSKKLERIINSCN